MVDVATDRMIGPTDDLDVAERALRAGRLVVVPTETVHGLAARADDGAAVARVFEAKGRPAFNPLIAHVADLAMADRLGVLDERARALGERLWPGPLTLVVPLRQGAHEGAPVHPLATAGLATIALRVARGPMSALARRVGALVAPSANVSGRVSPTATAHVMADLAPRLGPGDVVLDGALAPGEVGLESTIVSLVGPPVLLRPGGTPRGAIEDALGMALRDHDGVIAAPLAAPGMLASHYAPRGLVRLDAADAGADEFVIGFGPHRAAGEGAGRFELSPAADLTEAARNLFAALHAANAAGARRIAVEPVPAEGLGEAINDRLRRAAAERG